MHHPTSEQGYFTEKAGASVRALQDSCFDQTKKSFPLTFNKKSSPRKIILTSPVLPVGASISPTSTHSSCAFHEDYAFLASTFDTCFFRRRFAKLMKHKSQHSRHHRTPFKRNYYNARLILRSAVLTTESDLPLELSSDVYPVSKIFVPQVIYLPGRCSGGEGFIFELPHLINALLMQLSTGKVFLEFLWLLRESLSKCCSRRTSIGVQVTSCLLTIGLKCGSAAGSSRLLPLPGNYVAWWRDWKCRVAFMSS